MQLSTQVVVHGALAEWHARGVSDHSPLTVVMRQKAARRTDMPVPLHVFRSKLYSEYAPKYVALACAGGGASAVDRWRDTKIAIKAAATSARERVADAADADIESADGVMRSTSRAVMRFDAWLAARLLQGSGLARRELCVSAGRVALRDGEGFAERFAAARTAAFEASEKGAQAIGRRGRGRGKALQRMLAFWAPRARRLVLVRVEAEAESEDAGRAGRREQSEEERVDALRAHWRPVFERGPTDASARRLWATCRTQAWPRFGKRRAQA